MTSQCRVAVRMATGEVFSDAEIDDFLNRLAARAKRKRTADVSLGDRAVIRLAAEELTREDLHQALETRRMEIAAEVARTARRARIDALPASMNEVQKLDAYNVGSERQGLGTAASVDAEGRAHATDLLAQVQIGLEQMPGLTNRLANGFGVGERGFDRLVAREMARIQGAPGVEPTGDEGALHAARVLTSAMERARIMQNDQGAWIERLPGYIARQKHDAERMAGGFWREVSEAARRARAGDVRGALDFHDVVASSQRKAFEQWRDFIKPRLDPRSFEGVDAPDVEGGEAGAGEWARSLGPQDRMLFQVWFNVVSGAREAATGASDLADWQAPGSKARSVSKSRVLHFKDSDAWLDYNDRYGRGSLFSAVTAQLERAGRNTALMQRWGPSPEAAWTAEKARLADQARARGPEGAAIARKLNGRKLQGGFDALTGAANAPENVRFAAVMKAIRVNEALSKLGSMVLSKTTDLPMAGHTMARAGAGFLAGYEGALKGITRLGSEDAKHAAELVGAMAQGYSGQIAGRFHGADGPLGWGAWGQRLLYKVNGFDFINEGVKGGVASMYSRHLGIESAKPYDALNPGTKETFERYGITPQDWETARGAGHERAQDGKTYFTFEPLAQHPDLALKFRAMFGDIIANAVSEPRARESRIVTGGYAPGTVLGEAHRAFGQFKGFTFAIAGRHVVPAARGYAGYAPVALLAHLIVAGAAAGYLSLQSKLIVGGKAPRSLLDEHGGVDKRLWAAALTQGAGLGIYGDFLLGEETRSGTKFSLDAFGGPVISDLEDAAGIVRKSFQANTFGSDEEREKVNRDTPGSLVRFGQQHIPGVNLFYTRLALDYLVLWRMQEAASPGYLRRYQEHTEAAQHTHWLVSPASAVGG